MSDTSLHTRIQRILRDPGALHLLGGMLLLLAHIEDIHAVVATLEDDDWDAAADHTTLSADELEARVTRLFRGSRKLAEAFTR